MRDAVGKMSLGVVEFDPRSVWQKKLRRIFGQCIKSAVANATGFAGFALVTWDERGECRTSYYADTGPISAHLMPSYVADALNRHVAVDIAQRTASNLVTGE